MPTPPLARDIAESIIETIEACLSEGLRPSGQPSALQETSRRLGRQINNHVLARVKALHGLEPDWSLYQAKGGAMPTVSPVAPPGIIERDKLVALLRKVPITLDEIATRFSVSKGQALDALGGLQAEQINVREAGGTWSIEKAPERMAGKGNDLVSDADHKFIFGFVTDNHLGSKYARRDVLNDLYDRFAARGITNVYNAGNWIDGESRFNRFDLLPEAHGFDAQVRYLVENYPQRPGITTYVVAGDDHEGWYVQREGIDIGRYAERCMREAGREDWDYLGYMEADLRLVNGESGAYSIMRVLHPGGGSAYAISYKPQKILESYEGGDKPAVVLMGHYHKQEILNYRNVWIIQGGCTQDQTPFLRKLTIEAHIGGQIVTLEQDPATGAIISCNDMFRYFNKGYYEDRNTRWDRSGPIHQAARSPGGA